MVSPILKLEEQLSDTRSNQIAYKLTVHNPSADSISILELKPNVPVGGQILDITDNDSAEAFSQRSRLIDELNNLLNNFLWVESESFRENLVATQMQAYKSMFSFHGMLKIYASMIVRKDFFERQIRSQINSFQYKITSGDDARNAYTTWLGSLTPSMKAPNHNQEGIRVLFRAKLTQLEAVESRLQENVKGGSSLTAIEPDSNFSATYVLRFDRGLLEPKKYQVGFSVRYKSADADMVKSISVATNVQISPSPLSMSTVAIVSAIFGAMLRGSLDGSVNKFDELVRSATTGQIFLGPIVALIFFNVYEHTSLGKELTLSISWRSALLIGALCGLGQDRILTALTALIGA